MLVRLRSTNARFDRYEAAPHGPVEVRLVVRGRARANLGRYLVDRQAQEARRIQLFALYRAECVPAPRQEALHEPAHRGFEIARIGNLLRLAKNHDRAVIDRMVEGRASQDERVQMRHGHANRSLARRVQHAARNRAMQIDVVAVTPVERRDYNGRAADDESDVADEARVENRIDGPAVVVPALAHALDAGAGGGRRRFARRLRAPLHAGAQSPGPQLFENPMPQERGSLMVLMLLVRSPSSVAWSK